jgi:hypothetical protein
MIYQRLIAAMLIVIIYGVAAENAEACEVKLMMRNISSNTILAVEYRKNVADKWSVNLIDRSVGPNNQQVVRWQGDGYYEVGIEFTNRIRRITPAQDLCNKSELIAGNDGFRIR